MGEVYNARDTRLDRTVAVKVLPSEISADPNQSPSFSPQQRVTDVAPDPLLRARAGGVRRAWLLFVCTAVAICILLPWLSRDFGMTWDEQSRFGEGTRAVSFYRGALVASDFQDESRLYGLLFDVTANQVYQVLGGDLWMTRHRMNAAVGALGIVAAGLLAARVMTPLSGAAVMVLLLLSPRYVGHAMNNPKDIPFAAFCMVALLAFSLLRDEFPFLSWTTAVVVGLALALPLNVRPGALLYLGYFGASVFGLAVRARAWSPRQLIPVAGRMIAAGVVMLVAGCAFWPWALQNPLVRPFLALRGVAAFPWNGTTLFNGQSILATQLPWSYLPTWMVITTPPVVLVGIALSIAAVTAEARHRRLWTAGLWGVAACPVLLAIVMRATLYDGWRHLLFIYPPMVILAVAGWRFVLNEARVKAMRVVSVALVVAGCLEPLQFIVRNHPNEVVYFNAIVGGPRGAWGRFELDYWGNSVLQATAWTAALAERAGVPLCISGVPYSVVRGDAGRFGSLYSEWPYRHAHHVEVVLARDDRESLAKLAARTDAIHVIATADGAPLAYILPGPHMDAVRDRITDACQRRK